ncbi:hypothetical protein ACFVH4_24565 [Nocardia ignorata]|uniref:hypothetical protein n=1 Tax=Nocardia ignorata TaxID=145285 RepID=UPI003634EFD1
MAVQVCWSCWKTSATIIDEIGQQLRLLQRSFDTFDEAVAAHLRLNRTDMRCLDIV